MATAISIPFVYMFWSLLTQFPVKNGRALFGKPIGQFSAQFFQLAWLAQLVFAVQIARTNQKQLKGEIQAPQPTAQFRKPTKKLTGTQASDYFSREIARGQIQNGERIIKSFIG